MSKGFSYLHPDLPHDVEDRVAAMNPESGKVLMLLVMFVQSL